MKSNPIYDAHDLAAIPLSSENLSALTGASPDDATTRFAEIAAVFVKTGCNPADVLISVHDRSNVTEHVNDYRPACRRFFMASAPIDGGDYDWCDLIV